MLDGPQRIETGFVSNAGNIDLFVKNFSIRFCRRGATTSPRSSAS
jgi:hypothetical protein